MELNSMGTFLLSLWYFLQNPDSKRWFLVSNYCTWNLLVVIYFYLSIIHMACVCIVHQQKSSTIKLVCTVIVPIATTKWVCTSDMRERYVITSFYFLKNTRSLSVYHFFINILLNLLNFTYYHLAIVNVMCIGNI